jgi:hypothetical protein
VALSPYEILKRDQEAAARYAERSSQERTKQLLERAQSELTQRLAQATELKGLGSDSFTVAQMQAALAQVRAALKPLVLGVQSSAVELGKSAAFNSVGTTMKYIAQAEATHRGAARPLPFDTAAMNDVAIRDTEASILRRLGADPNHPGNAGVLGRYGANVFGKFEEVLQQRLIQGKSLDEARNDLVAQSPFLQSAAPFWTERILRTEQMNAHGAASLEALNQVESIVGAMLKILSATFDNRTASDSYAVHGQIRRPNEAFVSWFGPYMHPPNRPNDREVVVPHNMSWPLPPSLEPMSDGAVAARWAQEGRKTAMPARPLMSTVDRTLIGKQQVVPMANIPVPAIPVTGTPPTPTILKGPAESPARAFSFPSPVRIEPLPMPGDGTIPALEFTPPPLVILHEQIGPQGGSNPGGVYKGSDGIERYVKFYDDPTQAAGEHLANKIYEKLGLGALKSTLFEHDGKTAYASEMVSGATQIKNKLSGKGSMKVAEKALDGFAADVLLANWDAVGMSMDNLIVTPSNRVMRVDNGGALLSRARAGRKSQAALNNPAAEWEGFFNPTVNPAYANVAKAAGVFEAGDMADRVIKSINKIEKLAKQKGGWGKFVDEHAPGMNPADRDQVVEMLTTRTSFLRNKRDELEAKIAEAKSPKAVTLRPIEAEELQLARETYAMNVEPAAEHFTSNSEHHYVIRNYTGNGYKGMNQALYKPLEQLQREGVTENELKARVEKNNILAQSLEMAKMKGLAVEGVVYRGIEAWPGLMNEIQSGEFGFSCFASTSTDRKTSESFAGGEHGSAPVLFRLRQKSAIPIDKVSVNDGEKEALLPPGVRFRVISKERWGSGRGMIIDAEEIE